MPPRRPAETPAQPRVPLPASIGAAELMRLAAPRGGPAGRALPNAGLRRGLVGSVLLHSLPLLALIGWHPVPENAPTPIPIELVIEQPPPVPEPPAKAPPVRAASADLAETASPKPEPGTDTEAQPSAETQAPAAPPTAAAETSPAEPTARAEAPTAETKTAAPAPPAPPKPTPHRQEPRVAATSAWPLPLRQERPRAAPPQRFAVVTGPAAVRDEYCVRALGLTMRHADLLPRSYLGARRGRTVVTIRILGDGTINSVKLSQSSGYPDIDQRIEKMVFAVGRYPPLPPRMPGQWVDFDFTMVFPEAIEQ